MRISSILLIITAIFSFVNGCSDKTELEYADIKKSFKVKFNNKYYSVGDTIFGYNGYTYLIVGDYNSPLLIGVPHDGINYGDPSMPESGTTGRDISTLPLSIGIAVLFEQDTQLKPWVLVNTINRKVVDPNTYPEDAVSRYTNVDAFETYESYHELINLARTQISNNQMGGKGALFLDIHGHAHKYYNGHKEPYVSVLSGNFILDAFIFQNDIGYGLSNYSLEQSNNYLDQIADSSSIAYLAKIHPDVPFSQIIRGPNSFGGLLASENVVSIPSHHNPILERDYVLFGGTSSTPARRPYFNGGFVIRKYGTAKKGSTTGFNDNIIAIQVETPGINVRNNATIRSRSIHQFKRAIINYLNYWMGYNFNNSMYPY